MDTTMGDAPQQQQRSNNQNRKNNKNKKTCSICNKAGHLAKDCRSRPNGNANMNGNGNGNGNGIGSNGTKTMVDPQNTKPNQQCYLHPNNPHSNIKCNNKLNRWSPNNPANPNNGNGQNNQSNNPQQQQQQQQQQQPQPQQKQNKHQQQQQQQNSQQYFERNQRKFQQERNANLRSHRLPVPGADCNYCERCNRVGHLAAICDAPAIKQTRIIVCFQCFNTGHTLTECNHPAFCGNCRSLNHTKEYCDQRQCPSFRFFIFPENILPTREPGAKYKVATAPQPHPAAAAAADPKAAPQEPKASSAPQATQPTPKSAFFRHNAPQGQQGHPFLGRVPAFFHQGEWYPVPNDLHPVRKLVAQLATQQAADYKRAVEAKCQGAHATYPLHLLNGAITHTERDLATVDPINPRIVLRKDIRPTPLLERLTKSWLHTGAFARAAAIVRAGSNFFRDPRALDGIAKGERPVCLSCAQPGMVLDATFHEIVPGQVDVLTVEDHPEWGVSVAFACGCCKDQGFAWVAPGETC